MIRPSAVFLVALLLAASCAEAQVVDSANGKASARLMEKMLAGAPQDLMVVYDDTSIQQEARSMQSAMGLASDHEQIIQRKATRYAERKQLVLAEFGSAEVTTLRHYSHLPLNFLRIHSRQALQRLLADPRVVGVFEDHINRKFLAESLPLINQPQAAASGYVGAGTAVAVLDTGVDYTRAAFGSCTAPGVPASCRVVYAHDFAASDGQLDDDGHGTNVAGIVAGVAPGTKIIALDVFSGSPSSANFGALDSDIIDAMNWVIANKATYNTVAINLSLGDGEFTSPQADGVYKPAIDQARAAGILTVAAAGNSGYANALAMPAAVSSAVSVGAVYDSAMGAMAWGRPTSCKDLTTAADKVVCFSNSASFLTLLAPGAQILAAGLSESGTSQAAPHVSGAIAVLRAASAFGNETLDQTVARLANGVPVTDTRNNITKPRLDLRKALGLGTPCTYTLGETSKSFTASSGTGTIAVTASAGCPWTAAPAASSSGWLTVTSGSSGSASGTVAYAVAANANAAGRSGTINISGQTYTVIQSGATGSLVNILGNPGFEEGQASWTTQTASSDPIISTYAKPISPTNTWYAWLCGYNDCADTLYQDVAIPAAQGAYVQFNYSITTKETSSLRDYDLMSLRIYSPPTATTYTHWDFSNRNATSGWVASPQYDLSAFRGQTIRLEFAATTDGSNSTSFYVDDVTLMVSGATADTQAPTVPAGLTATAISSSAVDLSWSASTDSVGVTTYRIYRGGTLLVSLGNVLSYRDSGLAAGTAYSYRVSACDAAGNCSLQSGAAVAATPAAGDTQSPAIPAGLAAAGISTSQIDLSWNAATDNVGVTSYKLYRDGTLLATLGTATTYRDSGLAAATGYSYTVAACDAAGNCSGQSAAATASTATSISFAVGWNLAGNSVDAALQVAAGFNDPTRVSTVWKWIAAAGKWAFYTPLQADGGAAYAAGKGYDPLTVINGGEGFWVNASAAFTTLLPSAAPVTSAAFLPTLGSGWSLISIGDNKTPRTFNNSLSTDPPGAGSVAAPVLTTLWAWNNAQSTWYFYASSLDNSNGLAAYAGAKGYLDFGSRTLPPGTGFWVNKP